MARRCGKKNDAESLVINFIVLLLALPFIGAYLLCRPEQEKKILGGVLFVIGLVVWVAMGCGT